MPTIAQLRTENETLITPVGTPNGIRAESHREMNSYMIDKMQEHEMSINDANDDIASANERIDTLSGGQLNATTTSTPTPGVNIYNVKEAGTYTNFGGLVVTTEDLEEGQVQLWRTDGVWSKEILSNPQLNNGDFDPSSTTKAETGKSISDFLLVNYGVVYDNVIPGTYGDSQEYVNVAGAWTTGIVPAKTGSEFIVLCSSYTAIIVKFFNQARAKTSQINVVSGEPFTLPSNTFSFVVVAVNDAQPTLSVSSNQYGIKPSFASGLDEKVNSVFTSVYSGVYDANQNPIAIAGYWNSGIIPVKEGDVISITHSAVTAFGLKLYNSTPLEESGFVIEGNEPKKFEIPSGISSVVISLVVGPQPTFSLTKTTKFKQWDSRTEKLFDIRDYGAVSGGSFDNTNVYTNVLKDMIAAGGGIMRIPFGVWKGSIKIPICSVNNWVPIEIRGDFSPTPIFGTIGTAPMNITSPTLITDSTTNSLIKALAPSSGYPFSFVSVTITNLDIRTYQNPQVSAVDMSGAVQLVARNLQISTNVYSVDAVEPTYNTSGLITPAKDNGALTILDNVAISGYKNGIEVNEHTDGRGINITCCYNGLLFKTAPHSSHFGRICMQRNRNNVVVEGVHRFSIDQLNLEHANAATGQTNPTNEWQLTQSDIRDAGNLGVADINWAVVLGDVGIDNTFTKIGGTGIKTRAIGS